MGLENEIKEIITDNQALLDLNRSQLRDEHKTKLDKAITPPYSKNYATLKGFKTPDLYVTGAMFKAMKLRKSRDGYVITSLVDYAVKLIEKYTPDIFGIAKSKQTEAYAITTPELTKRYKEKVLTK
jgi:hypothetical protein